LAKSGKMALPANHKDVQKNWEMTMMGKTLFIILENSGIIF
jgi:hypothetical protein